MAQHSMKGPAFIRDVQHGRRVGYYRLKRNLGEGNFSKVKLGVHELTRERVAIKIMNKARLDANVEKLLGYEARAMDALSHFNIVRLFEIVETVSKLYLVMEFAPGGHLQEVLLRTGALPDHIAKPVFYQILSAVDHIHNCGLCHRDIKAENIFIAGNGDAKLGDFGFSTFATAADPLKTFCGSPPYSAPELFAKKTYSGVKSDVWALGVLLYWILSLKFPFSAESLPDLREAVLRGEKERLTDISMDCADLIDCALNMNPAKRPDTPRLLASDWLRGVAPPPKLEAFLSRSELAGRPLRPDAEAARLEVLRLGFSEAQVTPSKLSCLREVATGVYRMKLHKIQMENLAARKDGAGLSNLAQSSSMENAAMPEKKSKSKAGSTGGTAARRPSKLCIIL